MNQIIRYETTDVIKKDDEVTIEVVGLTATGKVLSAWHGNDCGWYIEMLDNRTGEYRYYKQVYDGGYVVKINGNRV